MKEYKPEDISVILVFSDGTEHEITGWADVPTIKDSYICDCDINYGKNCKYPDKYRNGGCK